MSRHAEALGFAASSAPNDAYNEAAFRHFLALERVRSTRSGRSFFLLLVSLRQQPGGERASLHAFSPNLFAALHECLRDGDFLGWYRDGRVAGAVLTQGADAPGSNASEGIVARVSRSLRADLPAPVAASLRIRVVRSGDHRV